MEDFKIRSNISIKKYGLNIKKNILQAIFDFIFFPLICLLPYKYVQFLHLTDLGRERRRAVIPYLKGKILDVGCGPLDELKNEYINSDDISTSDIVQWGNVDVVCPAEKLQFDNNSFDTVLMLACLNHIEDRNTALKETNRVLKKGGRIIITMINPFIGYLVHKICSWFDYDHIRGIKQKEEMGLSNKAVLILLKNNGFKNIYIKRFLYGLNKVFIAEKV